MKTSNQLLIAGILIVIFSMIGYDLALRAEYRKGEYKSRFYGFDKTTTFNGFTKIDNRVANLISVDVEKGPEAAIWIKSSRKDHLKISKVGTTLVIEAEDKALTHLDSYDPSITIICPSVSEVTTTPHLMKKDENNSYYTGTTTLTGFVQQGLTLKINEASTLILAKSQIQNLKAQVGDKNCRTARLMIKAGNQLDSATINVLGSNTLDITNATINNKNINIADSATVIMDGKFLNQTKFH